MTGFSLRPIVLALLLVGTTTLHLAAQCISGTRIATTSGDTTVLTCPGDNRADLITFQPNTFTIFYAYVLTDADNKVLTYSTDAAINFDGATQQDFRVWGLSYSGNLTIDSGVKLGDFPLADSCYELSSNFVSIERSIPDNSQLTFGSGGRTRTFCPDDNQEKILNFSTNLTDDNNYAYLITDFNNTIVTTSAAPTFDFGSLPKQNYRVWGVSYRGTLLAEAGTNARNGRLATACYTLSNNNIRVLYKDQDAGTLTTSDGLTSVEVCGAEVDNPLRFTRQNHNSTIYRIVVTDTSDVVQRILRPNQALQVNNLAPGTYKIWGISVANGLLLSLGDTLHTTQIARSCWDITDTYVELIRPNINGGIIATLSNADTLYNCIANEEATFNFSRPAGQANYNFVITDENGVITAIKDTTSFQLNELQNGRYTVYGMAFDGNVVATIGDTLNQVAFSDGCYDRSANFISINRATPNGGIVRLSNEEQSAYFCPDEENTDIVYLQSSNTSGPYFQYLITNEDNEIVTTTTADSIAFAEIGTGIFRIYGFASATEQAFEAGDDLPTNLSCAAVSEAFVTIVRQDAIGGEIVTTQGEEVLFSCPDNAGSDVISFEVNDAYGKKSAYIMTNVNGYVIDYLDTTSYDLASLNAGEYRIYHLSYAGELLNQTNRPIEVVPHASACYDLSENFLLIYREAPKAGLVASATFETTLEICIGADNFDGLKVVNSAGNNSNYAYIVTDETGVIRALPAGDVINFDAFGESRSRVYGVAFTGNLTAQIGENITETSLADECAALSINYITILPKVVDGGRIFSFQNEETMYICGDDGSSDYIGFYADTESDADYRYLVTDENNVILNVMAGNLENFDTGGPAVKRVWGISFMGDLTARVGFNVLENFLSNGCYALSENYIEIIKTNPSNSQISTTSGATELSFCTSDNAAQWIQLQTEGRGNSPYRYVLTDESNTILASSESDSINLAGMAGSSFRIYGLSYLGNFTGTIGETLDNAELAEECFSISENFVRIERTATDGGRVTLPFQETIAYLCPESNGADVLGFFNNTTAEGANYRYLITDLENTIIRVVNGSLQNFTNLGVGSFRVYGVSYTGDFLAEAGDNIWQVTLASDCYDMSGNYATVHRISPVAGEVETLSGESTAVARVNDEEPDVIIFNMPESTSSKWRFVVTNNDKEVLGLSEAARFDFESFSVGFYRVYGIVHTGELTLEIGDILDQEAPADGCFDITENYVRVICALNLGGEVGALQQSGGTTPMATAPKIAPNPAVDAINLTFESPVSEVAYLRVFNMTGKLMLERKIETVKGLNQFNLQLTDWAAGQYQLQIINSGKNLTTSFIKHNL